jgi:hypothetical protein
MKARWFTAAGVLVVVAVVMLLVDPHATWSAAIEVLVVSAILLLIGLRSKR